MKKLIVIVATLSVLFFTSCIGMPTYTSTAPVVTTTPVTTTTSKTTTTSTTTPVGNYGDVDIYRVAEGSFGVYGSLRVNNYQTGIVIDKNIKGYEPLYIINRINQVSEMKSITTEPGETVADIPIRRVLHNGNIDSVLGITSDLAGETLAAIKYNSDNTLTVSGFVPDVKRISTFTYVPDSEYTVTCTYDGKPESGYVQAPPEVVGWVTFDQTHIVIPPDSYAPIWINLYVPKGTELPDKWMFWIDITLSSGTQTGGVATQIIYKVGYKVDMR